MKLTNCYLKTLLVFCLLLSNYNQLIGQAKKGLTKYSVAYMDSVIHDPNSTDENKYGAIITTGLLNIKTNKPYLADSIFTLGSNLGIKPKANYSYYWANAKKNIFKDKKKKYPNTYRFKERMDALKFFNHAIANADSIYLESSKKNVRYLSETIYNDAVYATEKFPSTSIEQKYELIKIAKELFSDYMNYMEIAYPFEDQSDKEEMFSLALATLYTKVYYINRDEKMYDKALEVYETMLEKDPEHNSARYNKAALVQNATYYELEEEKKLTAYERRRFDSSMAMLDSVRVEFEMKKMKIDSIEETKLILLDEVENQKDILAVNQAKLSNTAKLLENQKTINLAVAVVGLIILVLLIFSVISFLKQKKQTAVIQKNRNEIHEQHLELTEKNREITDSIAYAKRIQSAIMPPLKLIKQYLHDSFIYYEPKDVVAGDFYWMLPEDEDGSTIFAAADCTGHGVPGAMVSVVCNSALNRSVKEFGLKKPGDILSKTRELVIEEFEKSDEEVKDGMDIALCSLKNNTLQYAGANNPLWIIRKDAEEVEIITAHKQAIGLVENAVPFPTHEVKLQEGDSFYIFSDGFADQFGGESGKKFKAPNFRRLLLSMNEQPMSSQHQLLDRAFKEWKGELEQIDDVCVIGVRV